MEPKQLTKEDVIKIIKEESYKNMTSGTPRVAPHNHDGNNAFKIEQKNIIPNLNGNAFLISVASETFIINVVANPTTLTFNGFAANNAADVSVPATEKAVITGVAKLGPSYGYSIISNNGALPDKTIDSFSQSSTSLYIKESALSSTAVAVSIGAFALAKDDTVEKAKAEVIAFTDKTITIKTTLAAGWQITGSFLIN